MERRVHGDAETYRAEAAARWASGWQRPFDVEARAFTCAVCQLEKDDAGIVYGGGKAEVQVCSQCCLSIVRKHFEQLGKVGPMKRVTLPRGDYAANHAKAIADPDNPIDASVPVPVVKRYEGVEVKCTAKRCSDPVFVADFDEIVREITCPSCNRPTPTPAHTWGAP